VGEKAMKNLSRINLPSITTDQSEIGTENNQPSQQSNKFKDKNHINTRLLFII